MCRPVLLTLTVAALLASACAAPARTAAPSPGEVQTPPVGAAPAVDPALDGWVRAYVRDGTMPLRYAVATTTGVDPLTLVYLQGGDYCGSGGCTLLVLRHEGGAYAPLGRLSVVQTPIRVLDSQSHGRPDLSVGVRGGGAEARQALIPFDGRRYTSNPTVAPARTVARDAPGQTLITDDTPRITVRP